jgi:hypothetical protein
MPCAGRWKRSRASGRSSCMYARLDCFVGLRLPRNDDRNVYFRHSDSSTGSLRLCSGQAGRAPATTLRQTQGRALRRIRKGKQSRSPSQPERTCVGPGWINHPDPFDCPFDGLRARLRTSLGHSITCPLLRRSSACGLLAMTTGTYIFVIASIRRMRSNPDHLGG